MMSICHSIVQFTIRTIKKWKYEMEVHKLACQLLHGSSVADGISGHLLDNEIL